MKKGLLVIEVIGAVVLYFAVIAIVHRFGAPNLVLGRTVVYTAGFAAISLFLLVIYQIRMVSKREKELNLADPAFEAKYAATLKAEILTLTKRVRINFFCGLYLFALMAALVMAMPI